MAWSVKCPFLAIISWYVSINWLPQHYTIHIAKHQLYQISGSKEITYIKARESQVHMCTNLVPRPSPPPTTCTCTLQATKNWSRGKPGNKITSIPHTYVPEPRYEATRTSYPPKLFIEWHTYEHSLLHAEQVDTTTLFDNSTCTLTYCNRGLQQTYTKSTRTNTQNACT